jgi:hypothetical protein
MPSIAFGLHLHLRGKTTLYPIPDTFAARDGEFSDT